MAIKKFKESDVDPVIKKISVREVRAVKNLKHENIVGFKEAFKRDKKLHIVFEYVDQTVLELLENSENGLKLDQIKMLIFQVLKALDYLHRNNIIHRDVKPENLLVDKKGVLKLCDFGFARKIYSPNEELTDYVATRWYRSPELVVTNTYGPPVDIWSVGCILGELLDGEPMFPGDDAFDQLYKIYSLTGPLDNKLMKQMESMFGLYAHKLVQGKKNSMKTNLTKKYKKLISESSLDLLIKLLNPNPESRITAKEALTHEWFEDLYEKDISLKEKTIVKQNKITDKTKEGFCVETILKELHSKNEKQKVFKFSDIENKQKKIIQKTNIKQDIKPQKENICILNPSVVHFKYSQTNKQGVSIEKNHKIKGHSTKAT